jgi:hypothetical protein
MKTPRRAAERIFSYKEFREKAGLTKKEADHWTRTGVVSAGINSTGRRRVYGFESIVEGIIAKQLADFASRKLLGNMMDSLRRHLKDSQRTFSNIPTNPSRSRLLIQIYTRRSREILPGGGVRGVITYVKDFDPSPSHQMGKGVFLVVDLTLTVIQALDLIYRPSGD